MRKDLCVNNATPVAERKRIFIPTSNINEDIFPGFDWRGSDFRDGFTVWIGTAETLNLLDFFFFNTFEWIPKLHWTLSVLDLLIITVM